MSTCRACPCRTPEDLPCDCLCHGITEAQKRLIDKIAAECEKHDPATYPLDDEEREK